VPSDPLLARQWHLHDPLAGIDVQGAWRTYTGKGVAVAIIDSGIDYRHSDLGKGYGFALDYDTLDHDQDSYSSLASETHGTHVAGVIAAENNGIGAVRVAYGATIAGFRIGFGAQGSASQNSAALDRAASLDIANASWGYQTPFTDNFKGWFAEWGTALRLDVTAGRGGLGTVVVANAGNDRATGDNVNYHNFGNSPYVIAVAATDSGGGIASFSTPGAALLVAAPGSGILTTARVEDYASKSGTSFATPIVTGVVALMLEANPGLGYRDVQEILAYSANRTDPQNSGWQVNGAENWNGGGLHFSHDLGFGLVDATAAVRLAESWQDQSMFANQVSVRESRSVAAVIADGDANGLRSQLVLTSPLILDKVLVDLAIDHGRPSDLTVSLTSPSGTRALLVDRPSDGTGGGIRFELSANNFWGEDATGAWTLAVADRVGGTAGTLQSWTLTALGDRPDANDSYVYTDEFWASWTPDRSRLSDTGGIDMLNLAAVTGPVALTLQPGEVSQVAGKRLTIATDTVIENAWLGDGNDMVIGNAAANRVQAGRGDDTIYGGAGDDTLYGGPGADIFLFLGLDGSSDEIGDFTAGLDKLDLRPLFQSLGYTGSDPVADRRLILAANGAGTDVAVDPSGGGLAVKVAMIGNVLPGTLMAGVDYLFA
ncbi:MAG: furin, partial [Alphaproteobacteria bacterium]|nr:furin [Alphaproteobacteria bacterium]